ncbi:MAG: hypothetical protein AVDCRST_MAG53-163 [uncultured Solirubrobacteraceae bacterium]|uniref:Uncharacterized protein n=1 Tax=uncultured Solirubrobacteraceae bacterium TaxID=1162706 RepID=A0A6J4RIP4_9ACTN|nr:MAG: hypothetical protein AVDCRST_MAG53-163 [uncultured Solirubrobacteraceae bacterium]
MAVGLNDPSGDEVAQALVVLVAGRAAVEVLPYPGEPGVGIVARRGRVGRPRRAPCDGEQ